MNTHMTFTFYIYAFSRRFYPKRLTLHSSYSFYILSALAFPGNRTHDLGVASAMLYQLSYRKAYMNATISCGLEGYGHHTKGPVPLATFAVLALDPLYIYMTFVLYLAQTSIVCTLGCSMPSRYFLPTN